MENTHALLSELGYAGAILVPGEESLFDMYGKMGYECFGGMEHFTCKASEPLALQELTLEEYAQLRRQNLPDGGVIQEGETLDFLSRLVKFYQADGCIFCAEVNEDRLFCPELLGDKSLATQITAALGGQTGIFRTAGSERFAMYLSFRDVAAPSYFGFSFD